MSIEYIKKMLENDDFGNHYYISYSYMVETYIETKVQIKGLNFYRYNGLEDNDFYLGQIHLNYKYSCKNIIADNNTLIFDLYYKELKYCNTLYIDFSFKGKTYTKAIRIKTNKDHTIKVFDNIYNTVNFYKNIIYREIYKFYELYIMDIAISNYICDNFDICDLEKKNK